MRFPELVGPVLDKRPLDAAGARALMRYLVSGEATDAQIGGALLALRARGTTVTELAAFAGVLREHALNLPAVVGDLVDTCGTGGGIPSFNLSTAGAIVAAAAGARVAKHGNRAVTSKCGAADVLEAMGVPLDGDPETLAHRLETLGIVFLFAPNHHPAMRHVGRARKELGVRTVFNQLGPMANPAGARRQLIGVYDPRLMRTMAEALKELGCERALLVYGDDGLDEISPCGGTQVVRLWHGVVTVERLAPSDFGLVPVDPAALEPAEDVAGAGRIVEEAVTDAESPRARALIPNAAATLHLAGVVKTLKEGADRAREAIASGAARAKLEALRGTGAL